MFSLYKGEEVGGLKQDNTNNTSVNNDIDNILDRCIKDLGVNRIYKIIYEQENERRKNRTIHSRT